MTKLAFPVRTALKYEEASSTVTYIGEASFRSSTSSPVWRIKRITYGSAPASITIEWADGDDEFDNVWDNRASLSYS